MMYFLKRHKFFFVFLFYVTACIILLRYFGIQTGGEAEKYIDDAHRILDGKPLRNGIFSISYIGYSFIISLFVKVKLNFFFVGIIQCLFSFLAAFCLYKLLLQIGMNSLLSFLFFIAYLLSYPIQKWNFFLYTESLHTSLVTISFYHIYKLIQDIKKSSWLIFSILVVLVLFTRPVGIIFFITFLFIIALGYFKTKKIYSIVSFIILIGAMVFFIFSPYIAYINPDSLRRMEVICQVPESNNSAIYNEYNNAGLQQIFYVIKDEIGIGNFFVNGLKKLGKFYGLYRSYYSFQNNSLLICYTLLYPFAVIGIFTQVPKKNKYIKLFATLYILFTSLLIFITCDDWSNRFISPVFPFILFMTALGLNRLLGVKKV